MAPEPEPFRSLVPEDDLPAPRDIDTTVPHIARIYNYWLGGKDNFAVDREAAEQVMRATPAILPRRPAMAEAALSKAMRQKVQYRTHAEVNRFFDGLEMVEPGVVHLPEWRPDEPVDPAGPVTGMWGGMGRKG